MAKMAEKAMAPRQSEIQCLLARTRPTGTRTTKASMMRSRKTTRDFCLMYLGKVMAAQKKTVAVIMVWVEGKLGSPEPSGRTFQMKTWSKRK